ncbi:MAG: endolytic transglycosylase MltG [Pseudomonadota bacterium]
MANRHKRTRRDDGVGPTLRPGLSEAAEPTRVPARPESSRRYRRGPNRGLTVLSGLLTLAFLAIITAAGAVAWLNASIAAPGPLSEPMTVTVPRGEGARSIATRLREAGVIGNTNLFIAHYLTQRTLARLRKNERPIQLKAGDYEFKPGASIETVMATIARGRGTLKFVTLTEGSTSAAITRKLMADERLDGDIAAPPAEGVLLPNTYDVRPGMARASVLQRMNKAQQDLLAELWPNRMPGLPIQTAQEAIILASIVQREMGPRDDPKRIAAVFHNRLRKGMRLQSDPTILYGLYLGDVQWGKPIYRSEIRKKTAHNTYQIGGLPPTPICNPGKQAIEAVLNPAETDDLYFVADGRGGHIFSKTNAEHQRNVKKWRQIEREIRARERKEAAAKKAKEQAEKAQTGALSTAAVNGGGGNAATTKQPPASDVSARQVATIAISSPPQASPPAEGTGPVPLPVRKPRR